MNVARVCARLGRGSPSSLLPPGRAGAFNQALMDLGATRVPRAGAAVRGVPGGRMVCVPRGGDAARRGERRRRPGAARERFEDTNRWARGRVVASLAAGEGLPPDVSPARLARALAGLERDGLVVRDASGRAALPE